MNENNKQEYDISFHPGLKHKHCLDSFLFKS